MKPARLIFVFVLLILSTHEVFTQRPEIALTLNEQFFDAAIDAVLSKGEAPFVELRAGGNENAGCRETIRIAREMNGVRTAVRFREGKIIAPVAFSGSYNFPIVGCIDFAGWAETAVELEFDAENQRVLARAKVVSVSLNGTGGVGKNLLAPLVQSALDRKVNPIELVRIEKLAFAIPIDLSSNLRIKATGFRNSVQTGSVTFFLTYDLTREANGQ
jgi:hypothetical protein